MEVALSCRRICRLGWYQTDMFVGDLPQGVPLARNTAHDIFEINLETAFRFYLPNRHCSSLCSTSMVGSTCWILAFGSRFSLMAAKNSRSCSSMPFIETSTFD